MSLNKNFKDGDRVVFIKDAAQNPGARKMYLGKIFTIKGLHQNTEGEYLVEEDSAYFFTHDELELEYVYNSPLWRALK